MNAKLQEIFSLLAVELERLSKSSAKDLSGYEFESLFNELIRGFGHSVLQTMVGEIPKSKNDRLTVFTSFGDVCLPKAHPLSAAPGGFKITPYLQEQLCLAGTRMTFEEAAEQVRGLKGIDVNAKQIERLCHQYGESLGGVDWGQAYSEAVQLRLPLEDEVTYAMMDGSMVLTRQKGESWKEVKLLRVFRSGDRVEGVSRERNQIGESAYVAHLGGHDDFLDQALEVIPAKGRLVFICDGAKWIWKWVGEYHPHSTQILDLYHCKEHLHAFANI